MTKYDVNVTAITLTACGHRNATNLTMIRYGNHDSFLFHYYVQMKLHNHACLNEVESWITQWMHVLLFIMRVNLSVQPCE